MSFRKIVFTLVFGLLGLTSIAMAQDTPQKAFDQFKKCWDDLDWVAIKKVCTEDAYQQMIVSNIRGAGIMLSQDLMIESDDLQELRDTLQLLFDDHGLDKVEFKSAAIISVGEISAEEMEQKVEMQRKNLKKIDKQIKDILAKIKDRKSFDNELLDMCTSSPFIGGSSTLIGAEVKKVDTKEDMAFLRVENDGDITHSIGSAQIVLKVPPRYLRFKKVGEDWKYDGIDEEKSAAAAKEHNK